MKYSNRYADKKLKDDGGAGLEIDGACVKAYRGHAKIIAVPEGVKEIAESAFMCTSSVTKIILPENISSIGDHAFGWCESLKQISVPKTAKIDKFAFAECEVKINFK